MLLTGSVGLWVSPGPRPRECPGRSLLSLRWSQNKKSCSSSGGGRGAGPEGVKPTCGQWGARAPWAASGLWGRCWRTLPGPGGWGAVPLVADSTSWLPRAWVLTWKAPAVTVLSPAPVSGELLWFRLAALGRLQKWEGFGGLKRQVCSLWEALSGSTHLSGHLPTPTEPPSWASGVGEAHSVPRFLCC